MRAWRPRLRSRRCAGAAILCWTRRTARPTTHSHPSPRFALTPPEQFLSSFFTNKCAKVTMAGGLLLTHWWFVCVQVSPGVDTLCRLLVWCYESMSLQDVRCR